MFRFPYPEIPGFDGQMNGRLPGLADGHRLGPGLQKLVHELDRVFHPLPVESHDRKVERGVAALRLNIAANNESSSRSVSAN